MLRQSRNEKRLPPEARTLIWISILASHVHSFAPSEKLFYDARLNFHGPELETVPKISEALSPERSQSKAHGL